MKASRFVLAFVASLGWIGVAHAGSSLPLPGVTGPFLGDPTTNLFTVLQGAQQEGLSQFTTFTTMTSTASTQAGCTQLGFGMSFLTTTLGGTGAVCLPQARAGTIVQIANNTSQTVNIFGTTPTTLGLGSAGNDFINGTIATTAYTGLTNGKNAVCFVPQAGNWWCASGS